MNENIPRILAGRILVVEDDPDIHSLITMHLRKNSYHAQVVEDGLSAFEKILTEQFDLVILDMMLPQIDGLEFLQRIRKRGMKLPVLILSAKTEIKDKIKGLELGADDYLTKPFSPEELMARIKVLLRRAQNKDIETTVSEEILNFDNLEINRVERIVATKDKNISLRAKEFDLLWFMASSPRRAFTRGELLEAVWGLNSEAYEHTVTSHINRLRNKLGSLGYINTVWGVGYRFLSLDEK